MELPKIVICGLLWAIDCIELSCDYLFITVAVEHYTKPFIRSVIKLFHIHTDLGSGTIDVNIDKLAHTQKANINTCHSGHGAICRDCSVWRGVIGSVALKRPDTEMGPISARIPSCARAFCHGTVLRCCCPECPHGV